MKYQSQSEIQKRQQVAQFARELRSLGSGQASVRERNAAVRALMKGYGEFLDLIAVEGAAERDAA